MKLTDDDKAALFAIYDELPVIMKIMDAGVAKAEHLLLTMEAADKDALHQARIRLDGARALRQHFKAAMLELSKKQK